MSKKHISGLCQEYYLGVPMSAMELSQQEFTNIAGSITQEDELSRTIRGYLGLVLDNQLTMSYVNKSPYMQKFFSLHPEIVKSIARHRLQLQATLPAQNRKLLQKKFSQLRERAKRLQEQEGISASVENAVIHMFFWENKKYHDRTMNLQDIFEILATLCEVGELERKPINGRAIKEDIIEGLHEFDMYDEQAKYYVEFYLNSCNQLAGIIAKHVMDAAAMRGVYFTLTDDFATIVHILENYGTPSEEGTIQASLGDIVTGVYDDDDDDDDEEEDEW